MKKLCANFLIIVFLITLSTTTIQAETSKVKIENYLREYFSDLNETMLKTSNQSYTQDDSNSINEYIILKDLEYKRELYKVLYNGIDSVEISNFVIEDISEMKNKVEVMVYVESTYFYNCGDEESSMGNLFRVTLENQENTYRVIDLDTRSVDSQIVKDAIAVQQEKSQDDIEEVEVVNRIFKGRMNEVKYEEENTETVLTTEEDSDKVAICVDEESTIIGEEATGAADDLVQYDNTKAQEYAYKLGDDYDNYIFKRASSDSTNFISQCVWAGYGGTSNYTIPSDPSYEDENCVELKNLVKNNYRMTSTWWGRNYDSIYGDPPTIFCSVVNFYDYVTTNSDIGPRATGYNDGENVMSLSVNIQQGDVLQFYNNSTARYSHAVMAITQKSYDIGMYRKIRVAQHDSEYSSRPLAEVIYGFGGVGDCNMRLLRFDATSFE